MKWPFGSIKKAPKIDLDTLAEKIVSNGNDAGEKLGKAVGKNGKLIFQIIGTVLIALIFGAALFFGSFIRSIFTKEGK